MFEINYTESTDDSYNTEYINGIEKRMLGELSEIIKDSFPFFLPYEKAIGKSLMNCYQNYCVLSIQDKIELPKKISQNRRQLKQLKSQLSLPANLTNIKEISFKIEGRTEKLVIDSSHAIVSIVNAIKKDKHLADFFENVEIGYKKEGRLIDSTTPLIKKISFDLMKFINTGDGKDFKTEAKKYKFIASFINILKKECKEKVISYKYIQNIIKAG